MFQPTDLRPGRTSRRHPADIQQHQEEARLAKKCAAQEKERAAFEEIGFSLGAASVLVSAIERERPVCGCRTEDLSSFDEDGWVR